MSNIKELLEPFNLSLGKKQDLLNMLIHLRDNNVTTDELIHYLKGVKKKLADEAMSQAKKAQEQWNKIALKCPECATPMFLYPVNTQPADQTGDSSLSMWMCSKKDCLETIYNDKSVIDVLKEIRGGR